MLKGIRAKLRKTMKNTLIDSLITVITGISGGAAGLYLFWKDKEDAEKVTKLRAFIFIVLGLFGCFFIAPAIIEYFELKDGMAAGTSFLTAVFTDTLLVSLYKVVKAVGGESTSIVKKIIDKFL